MGFWNDLENSKKEAIKAATYIALVYATMIAGMIGKTYFDHLSGGAPASIERLFIPVIISPIVFNAFLHIIKSTLEPLPTILISFQNGFFWQDIMSQIKVSVT